MKPVVLHLALSLALLLLAPAIQAETRYVTDRLLAELYAQPDPRSPVVATLPSGTPLEVKTSLHGYTQVIAPGERSGWVDARLLASDEPAMATLLRLRDEQVRTRAELEKVRAEKAEASLWALVVTAIGALMIGFGVGVLWLDHRMRVRHGGFRI